MKDPISLSTQIDDAAITGLRETVPQKAVPASPAFGTAATGVAAIDGAVEPTSRPQLPDSWDTDTGPESELPVPQGTLLGDRYVVEGMFAEGGMGIVCLGRHAQLDQRVAIKFLRRALSGRPSVVQRFLNEARALAALRSEHVVRVMDVGQLESGRPYLVMEHLDGIDLDALVDRDGSLSVETAVSYVLQVCEALGEAHALGIVHRDIKPENLFLWSGGPGKDVVKVLDFGLAKRLDSANALGLTGPQDSMGSPCYMSPEQIATPKLVDSRTDVWSLGVVLHRLLTDTLPFEGATMTQVFAHVLNASPKSIREVLPSLDTELDVIVRRCLEKDPGGRFTTMAELADALNGYLVHRHADPSQANPPQPNVPQANPPEAILPPDAVSSAAVLPARARRRWPALAAMLVLASAAIYQADRIGQLRVRDWSDGWLTPARLTIDAPRASENPHEPMPFLFRGVAGLELSSDANGPPMLRAEPEPETVVTVRPPLRVRKPPRSEPAAVDDQEYR